MIVVFEIKVCKSIAEASISKTKERSSAKDEFEFGDKSSLLLFEIIHRIIFCYTFLSYLSKIPV